MELHALTVFFIFICTRRHFLRGMKVFLFFFIHWKNSGVAIFSACVAITISARVIACPFEKKKKNARFWILAKRMWLQQRFDKKKFRKNKRSKAHFLSCEKLNCLVILWTALWTDIQCNSFMLRKIEITSH